MNSAQGILSLLEEKDKEIQLYALEKLNLVVDSCWPEIANYLSELERLSSEKIPLAAYIASKTFYHLQEYDMAVKLAIESGDLFDLN